MSRLRWIIVAAALVVPAGAAAAPAQAAGNVRAAVSLTAPASGVYGSPIALRGRLWRYGTSTGIRGALVWLQRKPHGRTSWANIRNTRTGTNGVYAFSVTQTAGAYDYRVHFAGSSTYTRAYSPVRYPVVTQKVVMDHIQTWDFNTGEIRATGRVWPVPPNGTPVWLQRYDTSARVWVNSANGRISGGQVAVFTTRPGSVASYRLAVGARGLYGAGASAVRGFAHYVWRGAFTKPVRLVYVDGGGGIYVRPRSQDPTQSTMEVRSIPQGRVTTELDVAGCRHIATYSSHFSGTNGSTNITLYGGGVTTASGSYGQTEDLTLGADLSNATQLFYAAHDASSSVGLRVLARLRMLCAN